MSSLYFFQLCFLVETINRPAQKPLDSLHYHDKSHVAVHTETIAQDQNHTIGEYQVVSQTMPSALQALKSMKDTDALPILNEFLESSNSEQRYIQTLLQGSEMKKLESNERADIKPPIIASMVSLGSQSAILFYTICNKYNSQAPLEERFYLVLLQTIRRDLISCEQHCLSRCAFDEDTGTFPERDYFIWRAFVGLFSLSKTLEANPCTTYVGIDTAKARDLEELQFCFEGFVQRWSKATGGITDWKTGQEALARITWPQALLDVEMAETIWRRAMGGLYF